MGQTRIKIWYSCSLAMVLLMTIAPAGVLASSDELQELLEQVSGDYAEAYIGPLVHTFGVNLNSGLYQTAAISNVRPSFGIGVKFMNARLSEDDQTFRRVIRVRLDEKFGVNPGDTGYGEMGFVDMRGPTVFGASGDGNEGYIQPYYAGVPVGPQQETVAGLVETRNVPLIVPEASASVMGARATLRYLPEMDIGDVGAVKFWGFGLQYCVSNHVPTLPVGLMVGFFSQQLDVGEVVEADASSYFVAASKSFAVVTFYGGAAKESSSMNISYTYTDPSNDTHSVDFDLDGEQESRFTLGATLDMGLKINAELNTGTFTNYTAGAMFGF